jgi:hypothetical protein
MILEEMLAHAPDSEELHKLAEEYGADIQPVKLVSG